MMATMLGECTKKEQHPVVPFVLGLVGKGLGSGLSYRTYDINKTILNVYDGK